VDRRYVLDDDGYRCCQDCGASISLTGPHDLFNASLFTGTEPNPAGAIPVQRANRSIGGSA
jgi:hypothetical protein